MRCFRPRTVGFLADGKTIAWSEKHASKEFASWQMPCGKCLSCRLKNSRDTAIRCVHEASLHEKNSFITLTYSDKHLKNPKLQYEDFQNFIKNLRSHIHDKALEKLYPNILTQAARRDFFRSAEQSTKDSILERTKIAVLCAGEYGDKNKRPHWHALIFNWRPDDLNKKYVSDRGDQVYSSEILSTLWPQGISEIGSVTFDSAGYVARYSTKKLYHGKDGTHDFEPISRRSSKNAIGKRWIEKNWKDCFTHGYLVFKKGDRYITSGIPRYYEKWLKKEKPEEYIRYVTEVKFKIIKEAMEAEEKIKEEEKRENFKRSALKGCRMRKAISRSESEEIIMAQKFELLKNHLKL